MPPSARKRWLRWTGGALLAVWLGVMAWNTWKPLPEGVTVESGWSPLQEGDVQFLRDITAADAYGHPIVDQQIFEAVFELIAEARHFILIDMFLFNAHRGADVAAPVHRTLAAELTNALLERRRADPGLRIVFITDPINDVYGGAPSPELQTLRDAGVEVVVTDLDRLRDSNPLYSAFWRIALRWWARGQPGTWPDPFDAQGPGVSMGAWARLVNFKANHRKVLIVGREDGTLAGIVTSANAHDASSSHSNVALRISGPVLEPLIASELAIARYSGWEGDPLPVPGTAPTAATETASATPSSPSLPGRARMLTESAIADAVVARLQTCVAGDAIDVAMFYLSDRRVLGALRDAATRGAAVRVLLDPNKDAFGRQKNGIPNRPVATELVAATDGAIRLRWYRTHGEQFHVKLLAIRGRDDFWLTLGSANFTRRNVRDYNLEANIAIELPRDSALELAVLEWFDGLWMNRAPAGVEYTAEYGTYADPRQIRYWGYRVMEATGLSTF
ncbi:MAG TPA: phospholipase D-like domain-containing protein [Steroidobacteraceae bacterium]|nr:phospholipase D-like domain-containing protein [Steroidobacteraceae bacterium]HNS26760.1 phospholipase D-like domain-containing protein [Steroidobacteraceae bacterium]